MPHIADPASEKQGFFSSNQAALAKLRHIQALVEKDDEKAPEPGLSDALLSLLSPRPAHQPASYHEELSALSKLISATAEVVEKGILTESEAESVINHVLAAFVGRRVDKLVDGLFSRPHTRWYLTASHHVYDRIGHSSE